MADFHPQCPKCGKTMDRGHVPDASPGSRVVLQSSWAPRDPEARSFVGGIVNHIFRRPCEPPAFTVSR